MEILKTFAAMSIENLDVSIALTIGGMIVSITAAFVIVRSRVNVLESEIRRLNETLKELQKDLTKYRDDERLIVKELQVKTQSHDTMLSEIKDDIKTTMNNVQEIKEAVLTLQKG